MRRPTAWTVPMQRAVGIYLIASSILGFIVLLAVMSDFHRVMADQMARQLATQSSRTYTAQEVGQLVDGTIFATIAASAFFGLIAVVFGALTLWRRALWVLVIDMILCGFGILGLVSSLVGLANPNRVLASVVFSTLESAVATALFVWMLVGLVKFGPWAEEKTPAAF